MLPALDAVQIVGLCSRPSDLSVWVLRGVVIVVTAYSDRLGFFDAQLLAWIFLDSPLVPH